MKKKKHYIRDLNGQRIEVTDLEEALSKSKLFKGFRHVNAPAEATAADDERQRYWTDIHNQLIVLFNNEREGRL